MEFLEYINTLASEELKTLPGLTPALAEKVAAERPFATLDDFSNLKGLTEKRLATMMEDFGKKVEAENAEKLLNAEAASSEEIAEAVGNEVDKLTRQSNIRRVITWVVVPPASQTLQINKKPRLSDWMKRLPLCKNAPPHLKRAPTASIKAWPHKMPRSCSLKTCKNCLTATFQFIKLKC